MSFYLMLIRDSIFFSTLIFQMYAKFEHLLEWFLNIWLQIYILFEQLIKKNYLRTEVPRLFDMGNTNGDKTVCVFIYIVYIFLPEEFF
jgi:hypothetical protein